MQYLLNQEEYDNISKAFQTRIEELEKTLEKAQYDEAVLRENLRHMYQITAVRFNAHPSLLDPLRDLATKKVMVEYDFNNLPKSFQQLLENKAYAQQNNLGPR